MTDNNQLNPDRPKIVLEDFLKTRNPKKEPDFEDLFEHTHQTPNRDLCADEILPTGTLYEGVAGSAFLNGLINHAGRFISAAVLACSHGWDEVMDDMIEAEVQEPPHSSTWMHRVFPTKAAAYAVLTEEGRLFHTNLHIFCDDVMVLYRHDSGVYMYFWYDQGNRHTIGRFVSDLPEATVKELFDNHAQMCSLRASRLEVPEPARSLPEWFFRGWVSF